MDRITKLITAVLSLVPITLDNTAVSHSINPQERYCIYEAIWHEARGESKEGIRAVLSVIQNRVYSDKYPTSYCKVIRQSAQFSYTLRKQSLVPKPRTQQEKVLAEWILIESEKILLGQYKPSLPSDTLWYHSVKVSPTWSRKLVYVGTIGNHRFYSER